MTVTNTEIGAFINAQTEDETPDADNDFVLIYDASAGAVKKVTPNNLSGASVSIEDALPWLIEINPCLTAAANTNWNSIQYISNEINGECYSSNAQNDDIGWDVVLAAGTWTVELLHNRSENRGIYTVYFDASSVGTIDGYVSGSGQNPNRRDSITSISVATTAKVRLKLKMATKNGSATGYYGVIQWVRLLRTA